MKYFLDTEFIEGFHKPTFGKRRHFIDLISIGIVGEDGSEYYAISADFNPKDANDWVKKNVLSKLPQRYVDFHTGSPNERRQAAFWKSNKEIKRDLFNLFRCGYEDGMLVAPSGIEVYGYYADYDWVLFCSLFGTMMDLPKGFPMYCRDLKQMMDDLNLQSDWKKKVCPDPEGEHNALIDAKWNYTLFKAIEKETSGFVVG